MVSLCVVVQNTANKNRILTNSVCCFKYFPSGFPYFEGNSLSLNLFVTLFVL